jgi:Zn-dependent peptidase ImmA (M78 family)/DNA-binding XRE family transcriptional regulator
MLAKRIKRARLGSGLSQREAAERAGLSAMMISKYERGLATPSSSRLRALAKVYGIRVEYFFRPEEVELQGVEYRKRSNLTRKVLKQIEADVLEQAERFLELVRLFPDPPVAEFKVPSEVSQWFERYDAIEEAARQVREARRLGLNAIPNLSDTLEEFGILVLTTGVDVGERFDGLAAKTNGTPIIVTADGWPGDRQRLTLAHELGHLVLNGRLADDLDGEKACFRFAGAFLVPAETAVQELGEHRKWLEPKELYALKHEFGLSMMGWIYRAKDLGILSKSAAEQHFRYFSSRGWRKCEPGEQYPTERPQLVERLVYRALGEELIGTSKAAELLRMTVSELRAQRRMEASGEAPDQ